MQMEVELRTLEESGRHKASSKEIRYFPECDGER